MKGKQSMFCCEVMTLGCMLDFLLLIDTALKEHASPAPCCVFKHGDVGGTESIKGKKSRARSPCHSQLLLLAVPSSIPIGLL